MVQCVYTEMTFSSKSITVVWYVGYFRNKKFRFEFTLTSSPSQKFKNKTFSETAQN